MLPQTGNENQDSAIRHREPWSIDFETERDLISTITRGRNPHFYRSSRSIEDVEEAERMLLSCGRCVCDRCLDIRRNFIETLIDIPF